MSCKPTAIQLVCYSIWHADSLFRHLVIPVGHQSILQTCRDETICSRNILLFYSKILKRTFCSPVSQVVLRPSNYLKCICNKAPSFWFIADFTLEQKFLLTSMKVTSNAEQHHERQRVYLSFFWIKWYLLFVVVSLLHYLSFLWRVFICMDITWFCLLLSRCLV